jgi:glycosyltransferase involved in cell wall biosynthesis
MSDASWRPLVSVCLPTYNRPQALVRVVESILAQTWKPLEIVVTDDGDEGATRAALGPLVERVRYSANPQRLGLYANWNHSIRLAQGELVASYHDHDFYEPTIVERSVELFRRSSRVGLVHVCTALVAPDGRREVVLHDNLPEIADGRWFAEQQAWRYPSYVSHGSILVRRSLYDELGFFDTSIGIAADMEMLVRFCLRCDIGYVKEPLYGYSGRSPADTLFEFRWKHEREYAEVRRLNVAQLHGGRPVPARERLRLQAQIDERLLRAFFVMAARGRTELLDEGAAVIREQGSPLAAAVATGFAARASRPTPDGRALLAGLRALRGWRASARAAGAGAP